MSHQITLGTVVGALGTEVLALTYVPNAPTTVPKRSVSMNVNLEYYKIFYYVAKLNGITNAAEILYPRQLRFY